MLVRASAAKFTTSRFLCLYVRPRIGDRDGQTNGINFIPFVCPSSIPTTTPRARARSPRIGVRDGQTNGIKFIPFVCPSSIPTSTPRARARSPRIGVRAEQTNGKKYPIRLFVIYPYFHTPHLARSPRIGVRDGQTNLPSTPPPIHDIAFRRHRTPNNSRLFPFHTATTTNGNSNASPPTFPFSSSSHSILCGDCRDIISLHQ